MRIKITATDDYEPNLDDYDADTIDGALKEDEKAWKNKEMTLEELLGPNVVVKFEIVDW